MDKRCEKIIIKSSNGYFCHKPWSDKLVVTQELVSYNLKIENERFIGGTKKTLSWKKNLNEEEQSISSKALEFANNFNFFMEHTPVLDGPGLEVILHFEDKTKETYYTTYGDCVDEYYGDLHTLLQLISPLVDNDSYKPEYFNGEEPEYESCEDDED